LAETGTTTAEPQEGTGTDPNKPATSDGAGTNTDQNNNGKTPEPEPAKPDPTTDKHIADLRTEAASWRTKLRAAEKELTNVKESATSEVEKARAEARQEALTEATAEANKRILRAEVLVAASGKLQEPEHAYAILATDGALADLEVNDKGEVDRKAIGGLVDELIKRSPHLGVRTDPQFGARTPAHVADNPDAAMDNWLRSATGRRT
jgi:hypothetical protein